jgi:hypothetical protein
MRQATTFDCDQCHKPILAHEGFVRFKGPGEKPTSSSIYRVRTGDRWEGHLKKSK